MSHQTPAVPVAQRLLLGVAAVATALISVWVLLVPPATGFEVLYQAYPSTFWGVFAVGLLAVLAVCVRALLGEGPAITSLYALALLCALYTLLNMLPLFRGWALYGRNSADVLAHIGFIKSLGRTGELPSGDFYPLIHALSLVMERVGLPLRVLSPLFSSLFSSLYLFGVYLFTQEFSGERTAASAALLVSIPLIYGKFEHTFHPAFFSFMLLPVALFLMERHRRTGRRQYLLLLLALTLGLVFFHPVTSLYLLVIVGTSLVVRVGYGWLLDDGAGRTYGSLGPESIVLVWTGTAWAGWYLQFGFIRAAIATALDVGGEETDSVAETYGAEQVELARSVTQIVVGFIDRYGAMFVILAVASLATVVIVYRTWQRRAGFEEVWLASQFVVSTLFTCLGVFTYIVAYDPIRNARFAALFGTVLTGVFLAFLVYRARHRQPTISHGAVVGVVLLVAIMVPISITNTYQPWYHMTYAEDDGSAWFYENVEGDAVRVSHHVSPKMQSYIGGSGAPETRHAGFGQESPVPRYFGYRRSPSVGAAVAGNGSNVYLVTKEYDLEFYRILRPYLHERNIVYRQSSLDRLRTDSTVNEVYANGGYNVWRVRNTSADG